jgi:predicted alpha/beta-hydrolase family hydrolase
MQVILAHGASGTSASMRPHIDGLRARGIDAAAIDLPKRKAEAAVPAYRQALPDATKLVIGGHSYGGRVASLLAADQELAGLVLLSYPLHRPGHPEWKPRTEHWPRISCPVLLLSGEADPFARLELLRESVSRLRHAELVTYPRQRHGLGAVLDDALDRIALFVGGL